MKMYKSKLERTMRSWIIIIILMIGLSPVNAQYETNYFHSLDNDSALQSIKLPELNQFIESALEYSAHYRMLEAQMKTMDSQIKTKKIQWLDHFFIDADTRYGLYNYIFVSGAQSSPGIAPTGNRFSYFAAFSIRIPLSTFSKTKHEIETLKHTKEYYKAQQEQLRDELRGYIIEEYYLMRTFKDQMIAHQEVMQTVRSLYMKALRDLERGYINMEDITDFAESKAKAETDFYKAKYEFFMHAEKLFALSGYKLKPSSE
jgi:outer membrane protein TolC